MTEYLTSLLSALPDLLPLFFGSLGLGFVLLVFKTGYYLVFGGDEK